MFGLQIVIWLVIPAARNSRADHANNTLSLFVLIQYVPRLFLIFPLNQKIVKSTGVVAKTAWAGAAYNLLLFMLASHVSKHFQPGSISFLLFFVLLKHDQIFNMFNCVVGPDNWSRLVSISHRATILLLEITVRRRECKSGCVLPR